MWRAVIFPIVTPRCSIGKAQRVAELLRDDSATLNFSVGVLLVNGGKDTPEIQLKTAFIEIDGQPMMMMN